jgi:hypothetical protein
MACPEGMETEKAFLEALHQPETSWLPGSYTTHRSHAVVRTESLAGAA